MQEDITKTDQELVIATFADRHAFLEIVHRYEAPIRRYVKRLGCKDNNDADDILQEIFIKVFVNLNDYDQDLKFSSWLYRIAHNETITFFRKKNIRPNVLNMEDAEEFFDNLADDTNYTEQAKERYDAQIVQNAISALDQKYKEVLILRFLEEKSYTEISDILKMPEGTVATLINRGKKELKIILENKGIKKYE
jgi:RNA polymerase sigma-70 factor (ECF subfamily)